MVPTGKSAQDGGTSQLAPVNPFLQTNPQSAAPLTHAWPDDAGVPKVKAHRPVALQEGSGNRQATVSGTTGGLHELAPPVSNLTSNTLPRE
jgi:hypothetical protein